MASTKQKIQDIIQSAAFASAEIEGNAGSVAESVPLPELIRIQVAMIVNIASEHGVELNEASARELLRGISIAIKDRPIALSRRAMAGWLPGIDDASSGTSFEALTEVIGWTANSHFNKMDENSLD